jgi:hypothetical protein
MLDTLITSKTRVKLLLKFFLNPGAKSYLRNLETEFGESTNAIRLELNRFEKAGLLISGKEQNRKVFRANTRHPLYPDISNLIRKYVGFDQIIDKVVRKIGGLEKAYITGDLALGRETDKIELLLIGETIDRSYLDLLIGKAEGVIDRKIHCTILGPEERDIPEHSLLIWEPNQEELTYFRTETQLSKKEAL